ncbi:TPA: hypothetical protein ACPZPM_001758 [Yersinia enterocolitica]
MQKIGNIPNTRADNNGEFTDGNVAGGVPPTILPAEWFNTIQRELISILSAAGFSLDPGNDNQVLAALNKIFLSSPIFTGTPTTPTASAGTVNTQIATTAFVKNAGLQFGNIFSASASGAIPSSYLGGELVINGSGGITLSLPVTTGLSSGLYGKFIILLNASVGDVTLTAAATDNITAGTNSVSSITIKSGDRALISLASANYWHLIGGEASLKYSGSFGFSAAASGYQKLPTGMILQWGITNNASVNPQTVNLPVAFPNAGLVIVASDVSGSYTPTTAIAICSGRYLSNSKIQVATAAPSNTLSGDLVQWIAIGY